MSSLLIRASRTAPVGSSLQMSLRFCYENKRKSSVFIAALLRDGLIFMLRGAPNEHAVCHRMRPIVAAGSVVRILGGNQILLHQLSLRSQRETAAVSLHLDSISTVRRHFS